MATVGNLMVNIGVNATGIATGLARAEASLERFGSRMFFMGGRMTAGVTMPLALLSGAILKLGADFDDAMTESLAIMDDKGRAMRAQFEKQAIELSKVTTFSAKEIAKGYYSLASAGLTGQESLASMTKVAKFAQAGLMNVDQAAKYLSGSVMALGEDMIQGTGRVEDMARVADVLTKANNMALGTVSSFSEALTTKAAMAGRMYKIELEELVAVLMAYHQQNIEGRVAGQQTWMTLRDIQRATIKASSAWKQHGVSVFDADKKMRPLSDILRQLAMRFDGFSASQVKAWAAGEEVGPAVNKQMSDLDRTMMMMDMGFQDRSKASTQTIVFMDRAIRQYMGGLKDSSGETERVAAKQMESMKKQLTMMWRELQAELLQMFEDMRPLFDSALKPALRSILDFMKKIAQAFSNLDPDTQKWVVKLTMFAMALGPVISMLGSWTLFVTGLLGTLQTAFALIGKIGLKIGTKFGGMATGSAAALELPSWIAAPTTMTATGGFTGTAAAGIMATQTTTLSKAMQGLSYALGIVATSWTKVMNGFVVWTMVYPVIKGAISWLVDNFEKLPYLINGLTLGLAGLAVKVGDVVGAVDAIKMTTSRGVKMWEAAKLIPGFVDDWGVILETWTGMTLDWIANIGKQIPQGFDNIWNTLAKDFGLKLDEMENRASTSQLVIPIRLAWNLAGALGGKMGVSLPEGGYGAWRKQVEDDLADQIAKVFPGLGTALGGAFMWGRGEVSGADVFKKSAWWAEQKAALYSGQRKAPIRSEALPGLGMFGLPNPKLLEMGPDLESALRAKSGYWPDSKPDAAALRRQERDAQILAEIMGEGTKRWQEYQRVFQKNVAIISADSNAMERMLGIYKQFRQELTILPPTFEAMYQAENAWIALLRDDPVQDMIAEMTNFVPAMNEIEKSAQQLEWAFEQMGGTPLINPEYFSKHRAELDQLAMRYKHMGPNVQKLIDQYWKWAEAQKRVEDHTKHLEFQDRALEGLATTQAKIADKERELEAFRWDESDRTFKNMRRGWATLEDELSKQFAREALYFSALKGKEVAAAAATVVEIAAAYRRLVEVTIRLDLEREASAAGVNKLIVRSFEYMSDEALKELIRLKKAAKGIWYDILKEYSAGFESLANVFDKDGTGWISWLAKISGLAADAKDIGADIQIAWGNFRDIFNTKDWGRMAGAAAVLFAAVAKGIEVMDQATNSASKMKNILGGASVGAELGNQIVPGGWGALGGAIVGGLIGAFRSPAWVKAQKHVAQAFSTEISESMAKSIEETMKSKGMNKQVASRFHFADILKEAGGLSDANITGFYRQFSLILEDIGIGYMTASEGMAVFSDNFGDMATYFIDRGMDVATAFEQHIETMFALIDAGKITSMDFKKFLDANFKWFVQSFEESGKVASAAFVNLIERYKELGLVSKEVTSFIIAQGTKAAAGWTAVLESIMSGGVSEYASKLQGINEQIEETERKIMDGEGDIAELEGKLNELLEYRGQLMAEQSTLVNKYSADVKRMGSIILATFNQMIAAGVPWMTALDTVGSSLDKLIEAYRILGVTSDNAAVNELTWWRDIMTQNKELFAGLDGLTQGTIALSSMGKISQTVFDDLMTQGVSMFGFMKDAVAKFGGSSTDALRAMVPWLAVVRDMAKEYGLVLDADTQSMIDLAIEMGLMSATSQTAASIMKDGFQDVVTGLKDVVLWLEAIGKKLGAIPPKTTITIDTKITGPGIPNVPGDPGGDGGGEDDDGVPRFAKGVYATKPRLGWFGEGGEPELGGPVDFMSKALAGAMAQTGGTGQDIHVTLVMPDGDVLLKQVVRAGKKRGVL